jgi:hypothetical protein
MIGGGIGGSVPWPQQPAERLPRLVQIRLQRVKPVTALVVAGRLLLLGVRGGQGRVNIDRQPVRRAVQFSEPLARPRMGATKLAQQLLAGDLVDHPERRRIRGDRPEQRLLVTNGTEIRHALAAVGKHHRQIADRLPGS